jgi:hypothetical protein
MQETNSTLFIELSFDCKKVSVQYLKLEEIIYDVRRNLAQIYFAWTTIPLQTAQGNLQPAGRLLVAACYEYQ